jgi:Tfp pilus tip-associated adhesin PilY1
MNIMKKSTSLSFIAALLLSLFTGHAAAALNLSQSPLFLAEQVASNVMVMLDNSGSMKVRMYSGGYNNSNAYGGIFDKDKNYVYDPLVPVNAAAYPTMVDASGSTMIDTSATGAFVESNCTPAAGATNCWNGNFLNWATARRIDTSRDVLVGGKLESRSASNYSTTTHTGLTSAYKIVANNERSDGTITVSSASSDSYSPIPNNQSIAVTSPAENGDFKTSYDPYAKFSAFVNTPIYNSASDIIGEFGTITRNQNYTKINLSKSYVDPIVVAKAPSFNGADPTIIRIKDVTANSFRIRLQEWDYKDGNHTNENVSFVVIENGEHELAGGLKIKTGKTNTDAEYVAGDCGSSRTNNVSVNFASSFTSTPVVISAVITENDADAINTRVWDIDSSGFKLALQEEESPLTAGHAIETVSYIAIEPGTVDDTTNNFKLEAGTISNVNQATSNITYSSAFTAAPAFVAAMQTKNENDTAALRLDSNSASAATVHVEEERSCTTPNEIAHADESVGYFALEGSKTSFNLALVVTSEPTGVLHDVKDDVRLGISFYRYNTSTTDNDIYNGEQNDGGTMVFKIPKNPFVKKPTDTTTLPVAQQGYRDLTGYIGSSFDGIVDAVEHYPLVWGTTPIAENLWEVIQYFEQDDPHYDSSAFLKATASPADPERDPFYVPRYNKNLHCVNSNVLIVTDGEPFRDANVPAAQVDWDEDSHATDQNTAAANNQEDNLDDVAAWAFCEGKGDACKTSGKATIKLNGVLRTNLRDLRTETGMDGDQYLKIDTIGFAGSTIRQVLKDTADNAGGKAFTAGDGEALKSAMLEAFQNAAQNASASSVAANSTRLDSSTLIYQASLDSGTWSGQLQAFGLSSDGSVNTVPSWHTDTKNKIPDDHTARSIFTYNPTTTAGIAFNTLADFDATQQAALGADATEQQAIINYLRGDSTNDGQGLGFRARATVTKDPLTDLDLATTHRRLMGDIVNSNPWYVGGDNFGYSFLPGTEGSSYAAHLTATGSRTDVVYVGANDGMLHAFDATTGVEKFAYVPSTIIPDIAQLADTNYGDTTPHMYLVDGSPRAGDVYIDADGDGTDAWATVLVGTTGAGGRGVFALDVTNPDSFTASNVIWEFNNSNDTDMGYTLSEPTIVRMANDQWAAIVGNGYKSDGNKAVLFIIDIETGAVIKKIDTETGDGTTPNGLSSHIPVDLNGDRIVDVIYAGDLLGNLWKFDVSDSNIAQWKSAFVSGGNPEPMFTATDASSNPQPITAKPQVGRHPDGGVMVYFGTGQYFEVGDNFVGALPPLQTYYGLRDDLTSSAQISGRSELQEQTIDGEVSATFGSETFDVRITSDNAVNFTDTSDLVTNPLKKGWYMELISPANGAEGERVVAASILRGDRIVFTTLIPNSNPCEFGGTSWLMELDGPTGGRLDEIAFDLNDDGLFTTDDLIQFLDTDNDGDVDADDDKTIISGKKSKVGIIKTPSVISTGDKEFKYSSGTTGGIDVTTESSGTGLGRQSWRQLR